MIAMVLLEDRSDVLAKVKKLPDVIMCRASSNEDVSAYEIELCVSDNGVGVPPGFDFRRDGFLGFQIIHMLGEIQLKGKVCLIQPGSHLLPHLSG